MSIAENIKAARRAKGYTQNDLANLMHVKPVTVSAWEVGRNEPSISTLKDLSKLLSVPFNELTETNDNDKQLELDLERALDNAHSFEGKPISDRDREVVKGILRSYFQ